MNLRFMHAAVHEAWNLSSPYAWPEPPRSSCGEALLSVSDCEIKGHLYLLPHKFRTGKINQIEFSVEIASDLEIVG